MADFRMIKKLFIAVGGCVLLAVFAAIFFIGYAVNTSGERFNPMSVQRPDNVPHDAIFRGGVDGGYFIVVERRDLLLEDGKRLPAYWLEAYDSFSGIAEFKGMGIFISDREMSSDGEIYYHNPPPVSEILATGYFNGSELEFDINGHSNVGRIVPIDIKVQPSQ